ncbi:tripartite tricarboxylate transporter TctB family protein [Ruegeria sp. WL0004]|uniref:Tripartite tricarboxylate transporter TctB family protein n=1 Tax=Ruegeria marisflavi TaxID=2984152 RepID=A0ABT2WWX5_9RHOB|nr:tripartite tricarboxylate transporter TctB family protein [Ruegeria sp. WL0004]MCU9840384.1 tripartite tricarboxylate transporter TctB family protein [Ruegeria sp. WL0004]
MTSTRVLAAVIFVIAAVYTYYGQSYTVSFGDVLGPSVFTLIVGIPAMLLSGSLVVFPGGGVEWAGRAHLVRQAIAIAVLLGYAWLLKPLGFPLATFGLISALAIVLGGNAVKSLVLGAAMSLTLWVLFDQILGLPLAFLGYLFRG